MPKALSNLQIGEVSFCKEGMNPGARIRLIKNAATIHALAARIEKASAAIEALGQGAPQPAAKGGKSKESVMPKTIEELSEALEKVEADLQAATEKTATLEKERDDANAAKEAAEVELEKAKAGPPADDDPAAALEKAKGELNPALRKYIEDMEASTATANKAATDAAELAKKEAGKRELAELTKSAEELYPALPGEPVAKGKVLKAMNGLDAEEKDAMAAMLKAGNEAMAKTLNRPIGHGGGGGDDTALATLESMAKARQDKDGITYEAAYTAVTEENPGLYQDSVVEKNRAAAIR